MCHTRVCSNALVELSPCHATALHFWLLLTLASDTSTSRLGVSDGSLSVSALLPGPWCPGLRWQVDERGWSIQAATLPLHASSTPSLPPSCTALQPAVTFRNVPFSQLLSLRPASVCSTIQHHDHALTCCGLPGKHDGCRRTSRNTGFRGPTRMSQVSLQPASSGQHSSAEAARMERSAITQARQSRAHPAPNHSAAQNLCSRPLEPIRPGAVRRPGLQPRHSKRCPAQDHQLGVR